MEFNFEDVIMSFLSTRSHTGKHVTGVHLYHKPTGEEVTIQAEVGEYSDHILRAKAEKLLKDKVEGSKKLVDHKLLDLIDSHRLTIQPLKGIHKFQCADLESHNFIFSYGNSAREAVLNWYNAYTSSTDRCARSCASKVSFLKLEGEDGLDTHN